MMSRKVPLCRPAQTDPVKLAHLLNLGYRVYAGGVSNSAMIADVFEQQFGPLQCEYKPLSAFCALPGGELCEKPHHRARALYSFDGRGQVLLTEGELWNVSDYEALPRIGLAWLLPYEVNRGATKRKRLYDELVMRFFNESPTIF